MSERGVGRSVFTIGEKAAPPAGGGEVKGSEALPSGSVEGAPLEGFRRGGLTFLCLK